MERVRQIESSWRLFYLQLIWNWIYFLWLCSAIVNHKSGNIIQLAATLKKTLNSNTELYDGPKNSTNLDALSKWGFNIAGP